MTMLWNILSYRNATNSFCKLQFVYQSLVRNTKYRNPMLSKFLHSSSKCTFRIRECKKQLYNDLRNVNTNVKNNVILYTNNDSYDFVLVKIIFFGWIFCNTFIAAMTYNPKYMTILRDNISWKEYFKLNGPTPLYFIYCTTIGPAAAVLLYFINHRFVRYVILHKGSKNVSILTNHLFKKYDTITIPIEKVKITLARHEIKTYLPMKIQGRKFFYILDGRGKFLNEKLFDCTVGSRKRW